MAFGPQFYFTETKSQNLQILASPGLIVNGDVDKYGSIEISMFYFRSSFTRQDGNYRVTESIKRLSITSGYRHWFNSFFSFGGGFSASYTIGDSETVSNNFPPGQVPKTSASDVTEYGVDLSLQAEPWVKDRWSVLMDARWNYSLTSKPSENQNSYAVMVGLKYLLESRTKDLK